MVYVLSKEGKPLMPTERHKKVGRMLQDGLAEVVRREPFTIQLLYETTEYTQEMTLGVDAGSKHIGLSADWERVTDGVTFRKLNLIEESKGYIQDRKERRFIP